MTFNPSAVGSEIEQWIAERMAARKSPSAVAE
jgi:hypothetical protein